MAGRAFDIYQDWLDRSSKLLWDREFESLADMMAYPHAMETLDGIMHFDAPQKMVEAAADFRGYLDRMHTQDYFRVCKAAQFSDDTHRRMIGEHETYLLQGGSYVVEPYRNQMILEWDGAAWKGAGIRAHVSNVDVPILSPKQLRDRALAAVQNTDEEPEND